jgi:hypothetical protein
VIPCGDIDHSGAALLSSCPVCPWYSVSLSSYNILLLSKYIFRKVVDSKDRADNPFCRNGFGEKKHRTVNGQGGHLLIATLKCLTHYVWLLPPAVADKAT